MHVPQFVVLDMHPVNVVGGESITAMLRGVRKNQELPIPSRPAVAARIEEMKQDTVQSARKLLEGTRRFQKLFDGLNRVLLHLVTPCSHGRAGWDWQLLIIAYIAQHRLDRLSFHDVDRLRVQQKLRDMRDMHKYGLSSLQRA